jgi:putative ABC transport system substrate-binding protein
MKKFFPADPKRRLLLGALGLAAALPRFAAAQGVIRQFQVIVLFAGETEEEELATRSFFDQMRKLGWVEGGNIAYERLFGKGMRAYVEGLARSAVSRTPDLIFAASATIARAVLAETDSIPVVFTTGSDPVAGGLVASLARPGRNATGAYQPPGDVIPKRFELLREALPQLKRVGAVFDRRSTSFLQQKELHEAVALRMGFELTAIEFTNYEVVPKVLARFRKESIAACLIPGSLTLFARRRDVVTAAMRNRVALFATRLEWVEAGAVMSYGVEIAEALRLGATIADRILKGALPAETPVEQATKFELSINLRSAHALGFDIAKSLQQRADRLVT